MEERLTDFSEIIANLQDDSNYYGEYGSQFLHNSDIYNLLGDLTKFKKKEDSTAMAFGRAFHDMVMFNKCNEQIVEASTRSTKIYKEALAESGKEVLLLSHEYDKISALVNASRNNDLFAEILDSAIEFEVPNAGLMIEDSTNIWACKADILTEDYIYDIKTTSSLDGFFQSARNYNYDSQAYIYSTMFQKPMRFLVVEKESGRVGLFETSDEAYMKGQSKVERAEEVYNKYFGLNKTEEIRNYVKYGTI